MMRQYTLFLLNILSLVGAANLRAAGGFGGDGSISVPSSIAAAVNRNKTGCEILDDPERLHRLPSECTCSEPYPYSMVVQCDKTFENELFNDTIGIKLNILPCAEPASSISVDVTELDHDIDYAIVGIKAGEEQNVPIPGLSIAVPTLGHAGVDAAILIEGNPDSLTLQAGLNACIVAGTGHNLCASKIPILNRILPFYVLKGTYSFGSICDNSDDDDKSGVDVDGNDEENNEDDSNDNKPTKNKFTFTSNVALKKES